MKRLTSLFLAALLAFAPIAQADLRASSGGFGPITATSGSVSTAVTGVTTLLAQSYAAVSAGADTSEDTVATITVPANTLGANGALRLWVQWTFTNSANSKTLRVRYSGASGTVFSTAVITTQNLYRNEVIIANRGATNSQIGNMITVTEVTGGIGQLGSGGYQTAAVDTTGATSVVITCQKASAGEACTLEGFTAEVMH